MSDPHRQELVLIVLSLVFGWLVAVSLWQQSQNADILLAMMLLFLVAGGAHLYLNKSAPGRDPLLLPLTLILTIWGLLTINRVAPNFLWRQTAWVLTGFVALAFISATHDHLRWLRRYKYTWLLASILLLAATLIMGVNPTGANARRWLSVAGFFLQPSEVLRLLMIAFLAAFFSERTGLSLLVRTSNQKQTVAHGESIHNRAFMQLKTWSRTLSPLAPSVVMWLIGLALLATQQDLGSAALLLITYTFMIYLATGQTLLPLVGVILLLVAGVVGYQFSSLIALRINIWLNPWLDPQGSAFQVVQSLIAVASGHIFGQGPGQGRPIYVPAVHTDFPFAAISEEYGLLGALAVVLLLAILSLRAWRIARATRSSYIMLLAGGIAVLFSTQVFVIVGGNLSLLPLTGVTLPFVSYGGSSLLVSYIAVALLIRLSCDYRSDFQLPLAIRVSSARSRQSLSNNVLRVTATQHVISRRAAWITTALFVIIAVGEGYWSTWQSSSLVIREDNPRKVDAERAINRGAILARDAQVLASSISVPQHVAYAPPVYQRQYPHPEVEPIIGYYSLLHGVGGVESFSDVALRGHLSLADSFFHRVQTGISVTTTIDLRLQQKLAQTFHGISGAGIIMDWRTGEILALVSSPMYDANTLDVNWDALSTRSDAPLLNRATQGLYQPGTLLYWMYNPGASPDIVAGVQPVQWDSTDKYSLGKPLSFELENAFVAYPVTVTYSETIGQGTLRVTPLRIAITAAELERGNAVIPTVTLQAKQGAAAYKPRLPVTKVSTFAQISQVRRVGWYVSITAQYVTVLALELPNASAIEPMEIGQRLLSEP
jgi:cell division protein FtsW (lipid II flippase)